MNYLLAVLAGLLQGVTEFLPISSSGHLIIFHDIFNFNLPDNLLFDVVLHLGTFLALLIFFFGYVEKIVRGLLSSLVNWNWQNNFNQRLAWLVTVGTIPGGLAGYFLENFIDTYLRSTLVVAIALITVAIMFWMAERGAARYREMPAMTWVDAIIIGLSQILALIPGVSRSGITIITGLARKLKRVEAAKFSFLLSLPIIGGAGIRKLSMVDDWSQADWLLLLVGLVASFVSGYLSVKYLLKYFSRYSLNIFAWYRLIIGCLILIWLILFRGL